MSKYLVTAALQGPTHRQFIVEADSKTEAHETITSGSPRVTGSTQYNGHGRISHGVSAEEISGEEVGELINPTYRVMGVYTDTDNLQPFTYVILAKSAREAVAKALTKANKINPSRRRDDFDRVEPDDDLDEASVSAEVRLVSVRLENHEAELLHDVDEFS